MTEPRFLLDSSICVYLLKDATGVVARRVGATAATLVVTSVIAYAEVLRGIPPGEAKARRDAQRLFEMIIPLPFDQRATERYATIPFKRARFDRLIAAHALALNLTLVTNNEADLNDIPGLCVENWTL